MSETGDSSTEEEYGVAEVTEVDDPEGVHVDFGSRGTRVTVVREGGDIRLAHRLADLWTLSSGRSEDERRAETSRDAGEATVGDW